MSSSWQNCNTYTVFCICTTTVTVSLLLLLCAYKFALLHNSIHFDIINLHVSIDECFVIRSNFHTSLTFTAYLYRPTCTVLSQTSDGSDVSCSHQLCGYSRGQHSCRLSALIKNSMSPENIREVGSVEKITIFSKNISMLITLCRQRMTQARNLRRPSWAYQMRESVTLQRVLPNSSTAASPSMMSAADISTDTLDHLVEMSHDTTGMKDCSVWLIRDNILGRL